MTEIRLILVVLEVERLEASLRFYRDQLDIAFVQARDHGAGERGV